jgi:predicted O-linked N-acetylglucosamine transferase (SPINDLY family)
VNSASNRLPVLAAHAAPIQMTWLGYAGSTGCPAVDYRITDPIVDPPGLTEPHFTEALLRLPETFWCFGPPVENDLPVRAPSHRDGRLRFGTATRLAKVSPTCRDAWAELLRRAHQSVLVLAAEPFGDDAIRQEWIGHFVSRGIPVERIELLPARGYRGYLELLGSIDIGLDTFPFNGGTTVCQSLWMGTPVVGLAGDTSVSRVTASILTNVGLPELVANSVEEWIEVNLRLAAETQRREELRASLRSKMAASPLCDAPRFVRNLESAFRRVFAERCRGAVRGGA